MSPYCGLINGDRVSFHGLERNPTSSHENPMLKGNMIIKNKIIVRNTTARPTPILDSLNFIFLTKPGLR